MDYSDKGFIQLGKNIAKVRKAKKFSQHELADILDISREHLAKVETAKRGLSIHLFLRICDVLEVPPKHFFDFKD